LVVGDLNSIEKVKEKEQLVGSLKKDEIFDEWEDMLEVA
jgi:Mg/Co/Ni transporter MgtE